MSSYNFKMCFIRNTVGGGHLSRNNPDYILHFYFDNNSINRRKSLSMKSKLKSTWLRISKNFFRLKKECGVLRDMTDETSQFTLPISVTTIVYVYCLRLFVYMRRVRWHLGVCLFILYSHTRMISPPSPRLNLGQCRFTVNVPNLQVTTIQLALKTVLKLLFLARIFVLGV